MVCSGSFGVDRRGCFGGGFIGCGLSGGGFVGCGCNGSWLVSCWSIGCGFIRHGFTGSGFIRCGFIGRGLAGRGLVGSGLVTEVAGNVGVWVFTGDEPFSHYHQVISTLSFYILLSTFIYILLSTFDSRKNVALYMNQHKVVVQLHLTY